MNRRELTQSRARVAAELEGEVLEIGFGSGLNVPHYPATITRVRAVDPATVGLVDVADGPGLLRELGASARGAAPDEVVVAVGPAFGEIGPGLRVALILPRA